VPAYEEVANSPFVATNTASKQFTVAGDFDQLLLIPTADDPGHNVLRLNGDTGPNYQAISIDGSIDAAVNEILLGLRLNLISRIVIKADFSGDGIAVSADPTGPDPDAVLAADNDAISPPIDTFTVDNNFGGTPTSKLRGFGLNL